MATATLTLPTGTKVRTQSNRRYIVVVEYVEGKPAIEYRTSDLNRAITRAAKLGFTRAHVLDTVARKVRIPSVYRVATGERTEARWEDA